MNKLRLYTGFVLFMLAWQIQAQKQIAITIDDVPNIKKYSSDGKIALLNYLSVNNLPSAIFVNEGRLLKDSIVNANNRYLEQWIEDRHVTVGLHTYSHPHYSEVGLEAFTKDIVKGFQVSKNLALEAGKSIEYFRFPYNDLGSDSIQHVSVQAVLDSLNLICAPFTVESSDWMFNSIYEFYLRNDSIDKAKAIGQAYLDATVRNFAWMDSLVVAQYGRVVKHIYLCHDNSINVDYLPQIINELKAKGYEFISLKEAMTDEVYQQSTFFYKSWGISWVYRWIVDEKERKQLMRKAPDVMEYYKIYERIRSVSGY